MCIIAEFQDCYLVKYYESDNHICYISFSEIVLENWLFIIRGVDRTLVFTFPSFYQQEYTFPKYF